MRFTTFYSLLTEISKKDLLHGTDSKRIMKAIYDVNIESTKVKHLTGGHGHSNDRLEFKVNSDPSTENKSHTGYITYDPETKDIKQVFCDCKDFNYRQYYAMNKNKLASWKLPKKYKEEAPFDHNKEPSIVTNPDNKVYVCKHLAKVLQSEFKK
jgi:hypothetical protein